MGLSDIVNNPPPRRTASSQKECAMTRLARALPSDDDRASLKVLLHHEDWQLTAAADMLTETYPELQVPHYSTFQRHRAGRCGCIYAKGPSE